MLNFVIRRQHATHAAMQRWAASVQLLAPLLLELVLLLQQRMRMLTTLAGVSQCGTAC
jgi:hypothetical protein